MDASTLISIIIPLRDEAPSLRLLNREIQRVAHERGWPVEVIWVDDGSRDESWAVISEFASRSAGAGGGPEAPERCPRSALALRIERGAGKSAALRAGFDAARGDVLVTLDADLQDDPAEIPALVDALASADVAVGWKRERRDSRGRIAGSRLFNAVVSSLTGVRLHDHNCGMKALRRAVLAHLRLDRGMHRFIPAMAAAAGFRVVETPVHHRARQFGRSKYGLSRVPKAVWDLARVLWRTRWMTRSAAARPANDGPAAADRRGETHDGGGRT